MEEASHDDTRLFRESIGSVVPVRDEQAVLDVQKPQPIPRHSRADEHAVLKQLRDAPFSVPAVETGDELTYLRPGVQKQSLRKLKRGQISIQAELDLHGLVVSQASEMVKDFIRHCLEHDRYAVRIIHGKGKGSRDRYPVLKNKLNKWLQKNNDVLAFCSARPVDGGTGAVYVLLRRQN